MLGVKRAQLLGHYLRIGIGVRTKFKKHDKKKALWVSAKSFILFHGVAPRDP